jgi:hypothetical protein
VLFALSIEMFFRKSWAGLNGTNSPELNGVFAEPPAGAGDERALPRLEVPHVADGVEDGADRAGDDRGVFDDDVLGSGLGIRHSLHLQDVSAAGLTYHERFHPGPTLVGLAPPA